jgi:heavy metal efflux system protein
VATGIGSETQQPLARVVVGGMLTSAVLILLVLPAMYRLVYRHAECHAAAHARLTSQDDSEAQTRNAS